MAIAPVGGVLPLLDTTGIDVLRKGAGAAREGGGFGDMINDAIAQLDSLQKSADTASVQVATGQAADLHGALIAVEEAGLGLQLGLQVRNKVIEAYQEVMRMQV